MNEINPNSTNMNKIITYTLSWCPHCKELKDYLSEENIEYEDIDVENNEDAAEDIIEKTGQDGFPIILINEEVLIGFDKKKLNKILKDD
ncbi:MAG: glutaredoxin domain-containing protein [Candidatus Pacearchaeota archaeon]|jgi:glutaredoxin-like YruB-family protein